MEWSGASPFARQRKLEDVVQKRMADSFFVITVDGDEEPVYISETAERAMNPNFRFFDLAPLGPEVIRHAELRIKLYAKHDGMRAYRFLVDLHVSLPSLQYIGKSIEAFHHPLPENSILFHLTDGIYTSLTNLPVSAAPKALTRGASEFSTGGATPTSSYDALMRLATLDTCIQDALHTREKLTAQISQLLEQNQDALSTVARVPEARESAAHVTGTANLQRRRLESAQRRRDEMRTSLTQRRENIRRGQEAQAQATVDIETARSALDNRKTQVQHLTEDIIGQRRRCCEDIQKVYPIEPIPGKSLSFTIRGLSLPNSVFEDCDESIVSAALGYVAHTVHLLSFYLSSPLPYPIIPHGSTSTIDDPISQTTGPSTYPLFLKNAVRFKFEYAVFLLNKDIEMLAGGLGLRIVDIRQTLPNLKYLLYIATAGKGDLPARKAGGIRGLLRRGEGSAGTTPTLSRVGSFESEERGRMPVSTAADALKSAAMERPFRVVANGKVARGNSPALLPASKLRDVT